MESAMPQVIPQTAHQTDAAQWLAAETNCSPHAARQIVEYVAAQQAAVGMVPTQTEVVFERFFDESGGMQLVVHAPFGGRINRAWGLAMRKRFCRSYDFELQASADDDGFILSLGPQHSFPIESLFGMLRTDNVKGLLEQALLAVPMFHLRWRWNVQRSLIVSRMRNGKKVPPAIQRFRSEDMLTAVFPKLTGCQEEHTGDHEIPDHPLVQQTMHDCLTEALDLEGLLEILGRVERGEITFVARETREPSPFAYELLNANPYAFLDGGEVQERRARAVETRRSISVESVHDLGRLDPEAIGQVVAEAQPLVRDADELHDVLLSRILLVHTADSRFAGHFKCPAKPQVECDEWMEQYRLLEQSRRATTFINTDGRRAWVAAERLPAARLIWPQAECEPSIDAPAGVREEWTGVDARVTAVRGAMEVAGPVTAADVAELVGITTQQADAALEALEGEGVVLRGQFTPPTADDVANSHADTYSVDTAERVTQPDAHSASRIAPRETEWCHRRLLARIHRLTVAGLRKQIEPVDVPTFVRFLTRLHALTGDAKPTGTNGLFETIGRLQGLDIPAAAWEEQILAARVAGYRPAWLDELCLTGEIGWGRLYPPPRDPDRARPMTSITRLAPVSLFLREDLDWLLETSREADEASLSSPAAQVLDVHKRKGALFAADVLAETRLLPAELDEVIGELVARGFLTADGFAGLRKITRTDSDEEPTRKSRRRTRSVTRRRSASGVGRWSLWRPQAIGEGEAPAEPIDVLGANSLSGSSGASPSQERTRRRDVVEEWAWQLLRRWGVVFRDLLIKESGAPSWWELVQIYRRLEARGEIRGGRFVSGVAGEQFALGESIGQLRRLRDEGLSKGDELLTVSAADPLNLVGILTPHARVTSRPSNAIILLNGKPVARIESGELVLEPTCPSSWRERVQEHAATTREVESPQSEFTDRHARRFERRRQNGRRQESPAGIPKPLV
jgi:ATP-dependent helicase Lhr and Lhr-like helicase